MIQINNSVHMVERKLLESRQGKYKDKVGDDARMKTNICIEDKICIEKRTNEG